MSGVEDRLYVAWTMLGGLVGVDVFIGTSVQKSSVRGLYVVGE